MFSLSSAPTRRSSLATSAAAVVVGLALFAAPSHAQTVPAATAAASDGQTNSPRGRAPSPSGADATAVRQRAEAPSLLAAPRTPYDIRHSPAPASNEPDWMSTKYTSH